MGDSTKGSGRGGLLLTDDGAAGRHVHEAGPTPAAARRVGHVDAQPRGNVAILSEDTTGDTRRALGGELLSRVVLWGRSPAEGVRGGDLLLELLELQRGQRGGASGPVAIGRGGRKRCCWKGRCLRVFISNWDLAFLGDTGFSLLTTLLSPHATHASLLRRCQPRPRRGRLRAALGR